MQEAIDRPKYSIIVAAYNVAAEIDVCMTSLTRPEITNSEILVINDGSTDDTRQRLSAFEADSRVKVIDKVNGGLSDARNAGIAAARGQYLMFVDGDDWIEPSLIRQFDQTLSTYPDADLLVFGINEISGEEIKTTYWRADFWSMTNSACNKLFHRTLFDGVRFDEGIYYEDLALVPSLFLRARRPVTIDAALYNYRRDRSDSITQSVNLDTLFQLANSAQRCIERIKADAAAGRAVRDPSERLGTDWLARFETVQIFIPGLLHRARSIHDRRIRRDYIRGMLRRLPSRERIRIGQIRKDYGSKMAAGALLYRLGQVEAGHFLLHDTGRIKDRLRERIGKRNPRSGA